MVGAWTLAKMEAVDLPEKAAAAFSKVTNGMVGAKYIPVLYCGEQLVNGTNYMIICKQTLVTNPPEEHLVTIVINCSAQGSCSIVSINQIV